ncbi:MAG TPA: hypothetical protein VF173_02565 [Thermoanaerobaculia bacterium]|nr:hypothetical protein [Thermoanaerobaculia bacterium]
MTEPIPLRPVGPHPSPEEIYRVRKAKGAEGSEPVLLHVAGCALCSAEMARQEAFDHPEPMPSAALEAAWQRFNRGETEIRRPSRRTPLLALAATLAFCIVGSGIWMMEHKEQEAGPGSPEQGVDAYRGSVEATEGWVPSGPLAAPPAEFIFTTPDDGQPRQVKVFDAAQTYVWTSPPTRRRQVAFPETERQRLRPGAEYFWTVLGGEGEERATRFWIKGK